MNGIDSARERLERAAELPGILGAAYAAFAAMLPLIQDQQDRGGATFAAFMMAGASAASGRFAAAAAPSLAVSCAEPEAVSGQGSWVTAQDTAVALAGLSHLLDRRLTDAAAAATTAADRNACAEAARHARAICSLLAGALP